jgi:two-component system KDP operon response regulator KdpE
VDSGQGLRAAFNHHPDLVLLDLTLPGMDSLETCRRLREVSNMPIILLTTRATEPDIPKGLALGANDCLAKPFEPAEWVKRIRAGLRRAASAKRRRNPAILSIGNLTIDLARHEVTLNKKLVRLSPTEFHILAYLARNRGRVIPRQTLLKEIWGPDYGNQLDYLDIYVGYLKKKIEMSPAQPEIIRAKPGMGYYIAK